VSTETTILIGAVTYAGTACSSCGTSYRTCSVDVLRDPHDPKASDGCCEECRDESGHRVRIEGGA
jgi:hypothetical protein